MCVIILSIRIDYLYATLSICHESVYNIIADFEIRNLFSLSVPKFMRSWSSEVCLRLGRKSCCRSMLETFDPIGNHCIGDIITIDVAFSNIFLPMSRKSPQSSQKQLRKTQVRIIAPKLFNAFCVLEQQRVLFTSISCIKLTKWLSLIMQLAWNNLLWSPNISSTTKICLMTTYQFTLHRFRRIFELKMNIILHPLFTGYNFCFISPFEEHCEDKNSTLLLKLNVKFWIPCIHFFLGHSLTSSIYGEDILLKWIDFILEDESKVLNSKICYSRVGPIYVRL